MSVSQQFAILSDELCSHLYVKDYNKEAINSLIDELIAKPYKTELFVGKQDAAALITSLCANIKPIDEFLTAKTSHLINSIVTKQNMQFESDYLSRVVLWHIDSIKTCSDVILPDILHNMQSILQSSPHSGRKLINDLIGRQGLLTNIISGGRSLTTQDPLQIILMALKCVISLLTMDENKSSGQTEIGIEVKEQLSQMIVIYLMKGCSKSQDESIYCKIVISALRVLSHIYFNEQKVDIQMPEVMGICRYFILYALVSQGNKPERIMPAQQTIAVSPVKTNPKGGKKQKIRKQRNNAIESLKKEIPVSDRSLMKDVDNFENNSAYKPANKNYLDPQKTRPCWNLTSDSDMSDVENGRETKLIALRSRLRQSAANLFLVVFKMKDKKDIFGYWWALLPDCPDENNWLLEDKSKKTLAYAGITDPIARSRASALSVVLALLSGSRIYLSQAESSRRSNTSFIPFSVSLGYIITCMHKILVGILDAERSHAVILVALKCCAALVQATPYHKMQEGLISELVRSTRKFIVHRDWALQAGALITIGCVLSIDPKVDEILKAIEKNTVPLKNQNEQINKENIPLNDECDDFEEGYSDDDMFIAVESDISDAKIEKDKKVYYFKSWILDICFKNMGWLFRNNESSKCKPSAIPVILESLQVLSAIAFHHLSELLEPHITLLADVLSEMLQHEHQDVVLHSARTISIIGDAIQKLEQQGKSLPLNQCVYMWEKLLTPLSAVLQDHENAPAKAVVCDCIANIGEKSFKELPGRTQMLCCTLLIGSCSDEEPAVRAAAVRALAMAVMYRSLREDICFVSDCGENILRALAEPTLVVRTKAAWALGNLSDALVLNIWIRPDTQLINDLIGRQGLLTNIISGGRSLTTQDPLQIILMALKCVISLLTMDENKSSGQTEIGIEVKEQLSQMIVIYLMKGCSKSQDESIYCKIVISALRVLSHIYFNEQKVDIQMPEVMGICRYFILYALVSQGNKPERIMPAQQTIAVSPVKTNPKGGKKQKIRKQRNNAIESLKKEIPVSDRSLMKDVDNFENNSAYKPANKNYLDPQKTRPCWNLTSDSDMSDVENGRETKLIALRSRLRQSAANLFLVVFKMKDKKDIFGYWWALLPDCPDENNWLLEDKSKKTLAYAGITDPIARSRASALSVVLALLSGSRIYLSQAESRRSNTSFIPFSVSLGYIITCMHKILVGILDAERSHAVILVALKCCAALVQATPYHKMQEGLISELVRSTRKFIVHRDWALQAGALITIGCVLSIDPKVDEILKAIEKNTVPLKNQNEQINKENIPLNDECDDFEEGYSDDDMFIAVESDISDAKIEKDKKVYYFKSWILDICFKNMGWLFRNNESSKCKPSAIPVILESLQVLSAIAFHHLSELLEPHITLLADVLSEMLQHEHQDVVLHSARTISIIGDAIQKLEQQGKSLPLNQCVYMWEKLLTPLSAVLQDHENAPAKAVVCDCIANIGEKSFKELPGRTQMLCCTLLIGSCSDEEPAVRAAAVRALAMAVMYRSLREDICFVSDCGENILRALAEPTLVVRTKAAWALGNLSDALVLNMKEPEIDDIDDDLLLRLLEVSIQCANDNDKVKMSATRGLGNLLRLIKNENLQRHTRLKSLCETAIGKLLDCACRVTNMKVRWNACYALGNAMRNENLFTCFSGWQSKVLSSLCTLAQECKNLKVRINAAVALRAPQNRSQYGDHYVPLWRGIMAAMENAANVDDFNEYKHKDNLIEQLCVTLAHLCCLLKPSDLPEILDPLIFHFDCAKALYTQSYHKLPPENESCMKILQAAKYITVDLTPENETQLQSLGMLQEIFIWDVR